MAGEWVGRTHQPLGKEMGSLKKSPDLWHLALGRREEGEDAPYKQYVERALAASSTANVLRALSRVTCPGKCSVPLLYATSIY